MKLELLAAFGLVAGFLALLFVQPAVSQEPPKASSLFDVLALNSQCGLGEDELIFVYGGGQIVVTPKEAGCTCTTGSECSSGRCSCKLGANPTKTRCCHKVAGASCTSDSDCQSNKCDLNTRKCVKVDCENDIPKLCDSRPNGSTCRTNDDCQSGKCRIQNDGRYQCVA